MNSTLWRITLVVLLVGLILAVAGLLITAVSAVLLILAGVLFGVFFHAISGFVARHTPLSYRWSYVVVLIVFLAIVAGGVYWMGAQIVEQTSDLVGQIESSSVELREQLEQYPLVRDYLPKTKPDELASQAARALPLVNTMVQGLLWGITGLVIVIVVGLYVALEPDLYQAGLVKLAPPDERDRVREALSKLHSVLGHWIVGRIVAMTLVGTITAVGLWLLDVPMPIALGVIAALCDFVPNIGPLVAAVPQVLLALKVSPNTALYVILFNLALQTVEAYLITPIVERRQVSLPPALTIFAQLLMGVLFGAIGIIMAAPLTASIMLLVQMLYIRDRLGDSRPGELVEKS